MAIVTIFNGINRSGIYMFCGFGRMAGCGFVGMVEAGISLKVIFKIHA
jgi:hypothetical protein